MDEPGASTRLSALLKEGATDVVKVWSQLVAAGLKGRQTPRELEWELKGLYDVLVAALLAGATAGSVASGDFDDVRAVFSELSRGRARQGFSPRETALSVFALKDVVFGSLQGDEASYADFVEFSKIIDELVLFTFETYAAARESLISDQAEQLLELSTPVIKLWEGVVALPLIGTLDSARAQVVMEKLLETIVATGSSHAIIDITGVPAVDTQVAQHLLKTVVAARLMGADCVISGIRPQIAQAIVGLGIQFGDIVTKATLADALLLALQHSGVDVHARAT
jgi:rsbT co-antagonist protein RsbR